MDICFIEYNNQIVIHPHGVKGAEWFAKYLTTNVAPLYCEREYGLKVLHDMFDDGLKVSMRDANTGKATPIRNLSQLGEFVYVNSVGKVKDSF